jgi:hypothetical protein
MNIIDKIFGKWIRRNNCKCHFGDDDIKIKNITLNAVHTIDSIYGYKQIDFYMNNKKEVTIQPEYIKEHRNPVIYSGI